MKDNTVELTARLGLCVSCEICLAVCPAGAVEMAFGGGQYTPRIDRAACTGCGLCLELCPGIDIDPGGLLHNEFTAGLLGGNYRRCYTASSADTEILRNSTSGGVLTALISGLLESGEYESAFILPFDKFENKPARLTETRTIAGVKEAGKSKYVPASLFNIIRSLKEKPQARTIITATPCLAHGVRKFLEQLQLQDHGVLLLGLFCNRTMNFNAVNYFEKKFRKKGERLVKLEYRTKEHTGWPGGMKLVFDSGRELFPPGPARMEVSGYFQLKRCRYCLDKLNRSADISFGNCYIPGKSGYAGKSSVVVRSERGAEAFSRFRRLFDLEDEDMETVIRSQGISEKRAIFQNAASLVRRTGLPAGQGMREKPGTAKVKRSGEKSFFRLESAVLLNRVLAGVKTALEVTAAGAALAEGIVFKKKRGKATAEGGVIIVGGGLRNKGAQSMTFTVLDEIKRRFPGKPVTLFSAMDFELPDKEKAKYSLTILPWEPAVKLSLMSRAWALFSRLGIVRKSRYSGREEALRQAIEQADMVLDISGYALSSRMGLTAVADYLLNILVARRYSVPYHILPQSFGPLDFPLKYRFFLVPLIKLSLAYPVTVFARERDSQNHIRKVRKKDVRLAHDIVLTAAGRTREAIFTASEERQAVSDEIHAGPVGIIPNLNTVLHGHCDYVLNIYRTLIRDLLGAGKKVYILRHSCEDLPLCRDIKKMFAENEAVVLLPADFNAIELEEIIARFDFLICSRCHGIIHGYRHGVPALVPGWADKYAGLLEEFGQSEFYFDCLTRPDTSLIREKLALMLEKHGEYRDRILARMEELRWMTSIFDIISG